MRRNWKPRPCVICGNLFKPIVARQLTCSVVCRHKRSDQLRKIVVPLRKCKCCGEVYQPRQRRSRYCTHAICQLAQQRDWSRERRRMSKLTAAEYVDSISIHKAAEYNRRMSQHLGFLRERHGFRTYSRKPGQCARHGCELALQDGINGSAVYGCEKCLDELQREQIKFRWAWNDKHSGRDKALANVRG